MLDSTGNPGMEVDKILRGLKGMSENTRVD